ncbi:MAG: small ligand-binding sensory domain FIST [Paracoccaceae bacterium]|jgi:small ligand-binding sensory domain FIST
METATQTFRVGHAADADWETLVQSCLAQIGDVPAGANLGFVYVTDTLDGDLPLIADRLRDVTGVENWVGTVGFGVMVGGREYFETPAMVAMLGVLPEDSFQILPTVDTPGEPLPDNVMNWAGRANPVLGIVHADPRNAYIGDILNAITDDTDAFLVGGLTASRGKQAQIAGRLTEGGVSGVLFGEDVQVVTGLSQGCSPVGEIHEVTKTNENILVELDGRPALDVFREDIGEVLSRNLERVSGYIHAALPISGDDSGDDSGDGSAENSGDYLVRNIVGIDPGNKLVAIGERISAGDRVMFVRRDGPAAAEDLDRMLADVKGRAKGTPKAALYYSCVARGPNLFGPDSDEMKAVQAVLGDDVPLVGFFANGEISKNRLYSYTGVLTLIL